MLLCLLLFSVGHLAYNERRIFSVTKNKTVYILPFLTIIGTYAGAMVACIILKMEIKPVLAISSGFGWYSYAAVYLSKEYSQEIGTISFFANVFRELFSLMLIPFFVKYTHPLCAISSCAAPSMDVGLGLIVRYSGTYYMVYAFIHGLILSLLIPFILTFIVYVIPS